jgi:hypothetical protein
MKRKPPKSHRPSPGISFIGRHRTKFLLVNILTSEPTSNRGHFSKVRAGRSAIAFQVDLKMLVNSPLGSLSYEASVSRYHFVKLRGWKSFVWQLQNLRSSRALRKPPRFPINASHISIKSFFTKILRSIHSTFKASCLYFRNKYVKLSNISLILAGGKKSHVLPAPSRNHDDIEPDFF